MSALGYKTMLVQSVCTLRHKWYTQVVQLR